MQSLSGTVGIEGLYRSQETILKSALMEDLKTSAVSGEMLLKSRSYVWHPNFMLLDVDLDYKPGTRRERFLVIPDRSEVKTAERIHVKSTFFSQRPLTISLFGNFNHNFVNRELVTDVEAFRTDLGASLWFGNSILPTRLTYSHDRSSQEELQTGRIYENRHENFRGEFKRSFPNFGEHSLNFSYDDHIREYPNNATIRNKITSINLADNISFDKERKTILNSLIWYYHQTGSEMFDRFQINETVRAKLPENFSVSGNYQYSNHKLNGIKSNRHRALGRLEHQLFLSLRSHIYYEYINVNQTSYDEFINTVGVGFNYRKKIPTGLLTVSYEFRSRHEDRDNQQISSRIINEEHVLDDDEIVFLNNPHVNSSSVVITNVPGTIVYRENIDYVLIQRGIFLEVRRIPGGQIANGATVYVDYKLDQLVSHEFTSVGNSVGTSVLLFGQLIEMYFRFFERDFNNVQGQEFRVLKTISQRVFGSRVSIGFLSGGFEVEDYNSNIVPYRSTRYYVTLGNNFFNRLNASITGNLRDYTLTEDNEKQKFAGVSGRFGYNVGFASRINLELGYRFQEGRGIDLRLTNVRSEFVTRILQVYMTFGIELYRRDFSGEEINFDGGYVRIERRF